MARIVIGPTGFSGEIPARDARKLPAHGAQTAKNCEVRGGQLVPIKDLLSVLQITKTGDIRTIYKLDDTWIYWTAVVEALRAQLPSADDRTLFTGDGYPKQTNKTLATSGAADSYPTETRRLGVVPPDSAQPLVVEFQGSGDGNPVDSITYVYTLVTAWGEESAPSYPTATVAPEGGQHTRLKNFIKPTLVATGNDIAYFRMYRATVGTSGTGQYQLVKARPASLGATAVWDIPVASVPDIGTYVYDADDGATPTAVNDDLGGILPSEDFDPPPADMHGLIQYQNGILAAISGNQLCLSAPLYYYAWPEDYRKTFNYDIVAIGQIDGAIVAATAGGAYLVGGTDPATMVKGDRFYEQPCVSKQSLVSWRGGVIYAAPEELTLIESTGGRPLTAGLFTPAQWKALGPENLVGFFYDNRYFGFFKGGDTAIIVSLGDEPYVRRFQKTGSAFYGGYLDPTTGILYLLVKTDSDEQAAAWEDRTGATFEDRTGATFEERDLADPVYYVMAYDASGVDLVQIFKSPIYRYESALNMACARVVGDFDTAVTFELWADGTLKLSKSVSDDTIFRCPGGFRALEWWIQVSGGGRISLAAAATSVQELTHG